jgi:hypothetical protein
MKRSSGFSGAFKPAEINFRPASFMNSGNMRAFQTTERDAFPAFRRYRVALPRPGKLAFAALSFRSPKMIPGTARLMRV